MRIAICGAGLVGSYLYRLLIKAGLGEITIFETSAFSDTHCGIKPCAWGTSAGLEELIESAALEPRKYILQAFESMTANNMQVKARPLVIDKFKFLADLQYGARIIASSVPEHEFDRIIDCTGYNRAFLPPISEDIAANCVQYRVSSLESRGFCVDISSLGYAWCFPLSKNEYHIGAGSLRMSPQKMLEKLGWLKNSSPICACTGKIRLTAPYYSLPFTNNTNNGECKVWGAGEAIGCVAPLAGEGIIPGMKSARILLDNWNNPEAYEKAILKEFAWMKDERKVLNKAVRGRPIGLFDAQVLMKTTKRLQMNLNYQQSLSLLRSINREL